MSSGEVEASGAEILGALPVALLGFSADGRLFLVNAEMLALLGIGPASLPLGTHEGEVLRRLAFHGIFGGGDPEQRLQEVLTLDRGRAHRRALHDAAGGILELRLAPLPAAGWMLTITDLSDHVQADEPEARAATEVLSRLTTGIGQYDADHRLIFSNPAFAKLIGLEPGTLHQGITVPEIVQRQLEAGEFDAETARNVVARMAAYPKGLTWRKERTRPDGRTLRFENQLMPDGGWLAEVSDISEKHTTEQDARRRMALHDALIRALPVGVAVYAADRTCTMVNPAYNRILAHSPISVGENLRDILLRRAIEGEFGSIHDPEEEVRRRLPLVAAPYSFEQLVAGVATVHRSVPLPDGGHAMVVADVTALHEAQAELRTRAELFQTMLESTRHGIAMFDASGRVVAANRLAARLCGIPPERFTPGTSIEQLREVQIAYGVHGGREATTGFLEARRGRALQGPDRYRRLSNTGRTIEVVTDQLDDGGFVRSYTDVTAQVAAEAEATHRAATLQTVLDNMRHGILLYDSERHLLVSNELTSQLTGMPLERLSPGNSLDDFMALQAEQGEFGSAAAAEAFRDTQGPDPWRTAGHYTRRRPDGSVIEVRTDPVPDGSWIRSYTDITALTQAQEAAAARAGEMQAMLDNMRHGIALFDAGHRLLAANALCGELMGIGAALRPGMLHPEILALQASTGEFGTEAEAERYIRGSLETEWSRPRHLRRRRPDGTELEVVTSPVPGGGFVLTLTDITPRILAEREVERRAEVLATTLNAARQGITLFDAEGRVVASNEIASRLRGFPQGFSMVGLTHEEMVMRQRERVPPEEGARLLEIFRSQDRSKSIRYQRRRTDGIVLDVTSDPTADGGYVVSLSDVTELVLAREEAQRRAGILQVMLDNSRQGLVLYDAEQRLVAANALAGDLTGVPDMLVPGTSQREVLAAQRARGAFDAPGEDGAAWERLFIELDRRQAHRIQRNLPRGGRLSIASDPTPDGGHIVSIADITPLVRAEEAAEHRAGVLKTMLENNTSGIMLYDADHRLVAFNALAAQLTGVADLEACIGRTLRENVELQARAGNLGHGEEGKRARERLLTLDRRRPHRNQRRASDGRTLIANSDPTPDGGFVISLTDVSAVVRAEAEAERRAEILGVMLGNIRHGIALFDRGSHIVASNAKLHEMLELPASLLTPGTSLGAMIDMLHARGEYGSDEAARARAERIKEQDRSISLRSIRTRPNGAIMEVVSDPTPDGGWVVTYTDVTEDRLVRSELEAARVQAEAASRAKSRFLATMSHELRTPLNAVIGFSELLHGGTTPAQVEEFAGAIQEAGRQLLSLIDDILDITRAESGSLPVVVEPVPLTPLLEGVARMIAGAAAAQQLLLATDLPPTLPRLLGDERRLRQVLLNLLGNATKFTPAGGEITLRARALATGLVIEVRDTGIGIEPRDLERVFEPFTQIDSALARRFPGSGLGLHLCRALTEAQGGTLVLESTPGIGTTARIAFPADKFLEADRTGLQPRPD